MKSKKSKHTTKETLISDYIVRFYFREIKAHRSVLVGSSDYFHSLFTDNFQEKDSKEVVLKEVCFDTLQMLVEFIYTGKLSFEKCSVRQAIELADYLRIDCAIESLNDHISKNISMNNCLEYYGAFEILRKDVRDQIEVFIRKNLIEFHRRSDFLSLNIGQLKSVLSNRTPVERLYDLRAIVEWTTANKGYQHVPQLLPLVVVTGQPCVSLFLAQYSPTI